MGIWRGLWQTRTNANRDWGHGEPRDPAGERKKMKELKIYKIDCVHCPITHKLQEVDNCYLCGQYQPGSMGKSDKQSLECRYDEEVSDEKPERRLEDNSQTP
jgi:hypothetical protein